MKLMRRRENTGGLDFEDILKECEEFLQRDPGQRTYWQNRFEYILIDEFQDINYRQYSIVKILAENIEIFLQWGMMIRPFTDSAEPDQPA